MNNDQRKEYFRKEFMIYGQLMYENLLVAKARPGKEPKFDTMFMWDKTDTRNHPVLNEIFQFLNQASMGIFNVQLNHPALVNPIKDYDTYTRQDMKPNAEYLRGKMWLNATSGGAYAPQVCEQVAPGQMAHLKAPNDSAKLYSGRNAILCVKFYVMEPKQGDTHGKRGFGVNVEGAFLMPGGDKIAEAGGGIDVNQTFGRFMSDTFQVSQPQGQNPYGQQQQQAPAGFPGAFPGQQQAAPQQPPGNAASWGPTPQQAPAANQQWGQQQAAPQQNWNQAPQQPGPANFPNPNQMPNMGNPMQGAPAGNGQTQFPQTNTAGQMAQGQQFAPSAFPSNGQQAPQPNWNAPSNFNTNGQFPGNGNGGFA